MGGMDQNALFQMFAGGRGQRSGGSQSQTTPGGSVLGVNDLQNILSGIGLPGGTLPGLLGRQPGQQTQRTAQQQQASAHPAPTAPVTSPAQGSYLSLPLIYFLHLFRESTSFVCFNQSGTDFTVSVKPSCAATTDSISSSRAKNP